MVSLAKRAFKMVTGEHYGTPKEVWGFRAESELRTPEEIAREFIRINSELFQIEDVIRDLELRRVVKSLGATHVILQQWHDRRRIHRAYVTVHIDDEGRVYLVKNRLMPRRLLPRAFDGRISRTEAVRRAREALPGTPRRSVMRELENIWFPVESRIVPAWKVRLTRSAPREEWIIYLNARNGAILSQYDNLASATARGWVFDPNPVIALGGHGTLLTPKKRAKRPPENAYRAVTLYGLDDSGRLSGRRVTTAPTGKRRVKRSDGKFFYRAGDIGFEEVMVYYHIDAAVRYLEQLGFKGEHAIFRAPVQANVNGTREDNSWYSPFDRLLTFGTGYIDDAEDGETIVHELGHAVQDAICPDFGQSPQAAAIGEGFSDYFAASFFEPRKPPAYHACVMSWDGLYSGLDEGAEPPALRRLDTASSFKDYDAKAGEHENGLIWSAALWQIHRALGREGAARIIVESHFQLDAFTTMARAARAIIDADENLNGGKNGTALKKIFKARGIALT